MGDYEAIEILLDMAKDMASIEEACGMQVEPVVDEAIRIVDAMLQRESE